MNIAIIGAGPAGVMAGIQASKMKDCNITFFDFLSPLTTLLPTGGGRCNLAYAEFDNRELVKFYPRGDKFLLSVFSQFSTGDTIDFFNKIGVDTYIQDDLRIFPTSNSSKIVREKLLKLLDKKNVFFLKEKVEKISIKNNLYKITTDNSDYIFDKIIFAGGIKRNYDLLKDLGIEIFPPKASLCSLCVSDKNLYKLAGLSFKDIGVNVFSKDKLIYSDNGDFIVTHKSLSGPLMYRVSAYCTYEKFPLKMKINFINEDFNSFDMKLQEKFNTNSKKSLVNIISEFIPKSMADFIVNTSKIDKNIQVSQVDKTNRQKISKLMTEFELDIVSQLLDGEIVSAGGVNLDFINSKTMEYKGFNGFYFCGEVLNIDGLTGGFNLQNCWSTGYIAGQSASL